MLLRDLIEGLAVRPPAESGWDAVRVCDLTEDSRTVVPGSLFIARAGLKADGKKFVGSALGAGAVAILTDDPNLALPAGPAVPVVYSGEVTGCAAAMAERFYGCPSQRLGIVGVTGTNGKTTTTFLVWQLLNGAERRCGLIGTVLVDDGREVGPASMTTPPALELSQSLASMTEAGCECASMEISSHALDQKRADALRLRVGVFTNLTGDHLDYHKTMEAYGAAKARLFSQLPADGIAVVNADDPWAVRMAQGCPARVLRCTTAGLAGADCAVEILESSMAGMTLRLRGGWGELTARVGLIGRYNAMNVLQAACACSALGLGREELAEGLEKVTAPPGRLERVSEARDSITVFVDYAHSDDSLRNVLATVGSSMPGRRHAADCVSAVAGAPARRGKGERLWAVFGCGGDRDRTKRPRMGKGAAELADVIVVTSDNPRTERPGEIIDEILGGVPAGCRSRVTVQADREKAIWHAVENAEAGDVIVIAGKGHETEQILPDGKGGTVRTQFDDREVAREALAARRAAGIVREETAAR
ncbi:UDP-N-acetylmuramoyl-L-alanyl-D-glutamate--2, 6-diaminopimelate ligase [Phycisphaerales bacterium]|nr:UDP-N-acetylmuramoyl-L-alanyl-D-glutamate--2, 6-diaminopimelate ligase [Phycisphaerales bacterium]